MYRNNNGHDFDTRRQHCLGCDTVLHDQTWTLADHVLGVWRHYLWVDLPDVLATDDQGKTIEGRVAIPARRILRLLPVQNAICYCFDCAPVLQETGCAGCGQEVDVNDEHTQSEHLWKRVENQINGPLKFTLWHIDCLPAEFDQVKKIRTERKS